MMRFIFTGAQGTGKTTILNHFKNNGVPVITEIVRNLAKEGININEQGDLQGQNTIFNKYNELLSQKETFISDLGLTDVIAYSYTLAEKGRVTYEFVEDQLRQLREFTAENPDIIYFYFPIEFPVVGDGVRSTDEHFRIVVDRYIKRILEAVGIRYVEVRGTVEERVKIVEGIIQNIKQFQVAQDNALNNCRKCDIH